MKLESFIVSLSLVLKRIVMFVEPIFKYMFYRSNVMQMVLLYIWGWYFTRIYKIYTYIHIFVYIYVDICIYIYMYMYIYIYMYINIYIYICICVYIHIYTYIHTVQKRYEQNLLETFDIVTNSFAQS